MFYHFFSFLLLVWFTSPPTPRFEAQTVDASIQIGYGVAVGDVDGDGKPDILLADKKQFVWYRNGDWKRFVMVDSLTSFDNVCIAARDVNGDGKVEVAVGAQWNPGETTDATQSGSVHYLIRPEDPTQHWTPVKLYHEPTIHRMRWVKVGKDAYQLIVIPLHGRGNQNGEGSGVKLLAYEFPKDSTSGWQYRVVDLRMHLTHNFEVTETENDAQLYIGGKEGIRVIRSNKGHWAITNESEWVARDYEIGEVRMGYFKDKQTFMATIEPMHGEKLSVFLPSYSTFRQVLKYDMNQGHAVGCADFLGIGNTQIAVGWRQPDSKKNVGIQLFVPRDDSGRSWQEYTIDTNKMACEDLQIADLDADGKPDIIASGRATKNLVIYWNKSQ
jgi:hypothetical protein